MPDLNALPLAGAVNFCFPNFFLLPLFGNMAAYRSRPLGPEKCLFEIYSFSIYPEDEVRPRPTAPKPHRPRRSGLAADPGPGLQQHPAAAEGAALGGSTTCGSRERNEGHLSNIRPRTIDGFLAGLRLRAGCCRRCARST